MKTAKRTRVEITTTWEFSPGDLRKLLGLHADVTFRVRVPGGGDWSNTDLDIEDDRPLVAERIHREDSES